jgi:hypothetical protein
MTLPIYIIKMVSFENWRMVHERQSKIYQKIEKILEEVEGLSLFLLPVSLRKRENLHRLVVCSRI